MTLLTTKQVQELFKVDRSTIYRMAEDGRIPAVKVGRQWRFPSEKLDSLLGGADPTPSQYRSAPSTGFETTLDLTLPADTSQAIADLAADLFGVMAVVTDMEGRALTTVANPCGYFLAVSRGEYSTDRCSEGWRQLGEQIDLEPHFRPTHLGFLCARSFIRHGDSLIGMVIVGGIAPEVWPPSEVTMGSVSAETGIPLQTIRAHINKVFWIDKAHQDWILDNLPRVSDIFSHLADGQGRLMAKLDRIAALVGADAHL